MLTILSFTVYTSIKRCEHCDLKGEARPKPKCEKIIDTVERQYDHVELNYPRKSTMTLKFQLAKYLIDFLIETCNILISSITQESLGPMIIQCFFFFLFFFLFFIVLQKLYFRMPVLVFKTILIIVNKRTYHAGFCMFGYNSPF